MELEHVHTRDCTGPGPCDESPIGLKKNWVTDVGGLPSYIRAIAHALIRNGHTESDAIQIAVGTAKRWAAGEGKVTGPTRARAAAAVAEWEAKKAAAHGRSMSTPIEFRQSPMEAQKCKYCDKPATKSVLWFEGMAYVPACDEHLDQAVEKIGGPHEVDKVVDVAAHTPGQRADFMGETTDQGADKLLPVGPSKKVAAEVVQVETHRFKGKDVMHCETCGQPLTATCHRSRANMANRHAGPNHEKVPSGHIKGVKGRQVTAARHQYDGDIAQVEPNIEQSVKDFFGKQRQATLSRLTGKRGKTMLKRAAEPPEGAEPPPEGTEPVPPNPAAVNPAAIFDSSFWADQMAQTLAPHFQAIGSIASNRVKHQVGAHDVNDGTSLQAVGDMLANRAKTSALAITGTTRSDIFSALQQGVANGEGMEQLTKRINSIFDNADSVRAKMIAQTEAIGAMNQAATTYAEHLPEGIVGSKVWLAHHDTRTRPTHKIADGQHVPLKAKFTVGGYSMNQPGDPTAPPGEVINCRCGVGMMPPEMSTTTAFKSLEGLVPATTWAALTKIQAERDKKYPVPA